MKHPGNICEQLYYKYSEPCGTMLIIFCTIAPLGDKTWDVFETDGLLHSDGIRNYQFAVLFNRIAYLVMHLNAAVSYSPLINSKKYLKNTHNH